MKLKLRSFHSRRVGDQRFIVVAMVTKVVATWSFGYKICPSRFSVLENVVLLSFQFTKPQKCPLCLTEWLPAKNLASDHCFFHPVNFAHSRHLVTTLQTLTTVSSKQKVDILHCLF